MAADADGASRRSTTRRGRASPADLTSLALVLATQCRGHRADPRKNFESRLFFVDSLIAMGARIFSATRTGRW